MELEEIIQRSKARPEIYAPALAMEALRLRAERDQLLARIEDTDSACADYAFAGAHTAREIIEKLHDRIRGYKTDRDLLAEANDQLRAENARLIATLKLIAANYYASDWQIALVEAVLAADDALREARRRER